MCGIFGYAGKADATKVVIDGLKRLEYRGYDSWGVAVVAEELRIEKRVGAVGDLDTTSLPSSNIGIGHTRWATHGGVTNQNAHPHYSADRSFCLAHNGIVENYRLLKKDLLKRGFKFETETDTEVIVRLIESFKDSHKSLKDAVRAAFSKLEGRNTIIILTNTNQIIAARNGSPLVVGINADEVFFSSDTLSFAPYASAMLVVDNGQMATYENGEVSLEEIKTGKGINYKLEKVSVGNNKIDKEGYEHFMLKEINEIPYTLNQIVGDEVGNYKAFIKALSGAAHVYTVGSGTAGVAAAQVAYYLRSIAKINAQSLVGADCSEYLNLLQKGDILLATSQSGETADVLEVLEKAKKKGVGIASLVNMPGSTMTRLSDFKFMNHAGPEICVVSTKVFVSQIAWGYLISKMFQGKAVEGQDNLRKLSTAAQNYLETGGNHIKIEDLAKHLLEKKDIFLLGKGQNYNIIREGMVKIIECSYKHAHAMPAGDLKHYAITIMEKGVPVIVAVSEDAVKLEVLNAVNEVRTRGAEVVGISPERVDQLDYLLQTPDTGETSAIMNTIPLYLLAYYMARDLGHNMDKPRNLAKSVTVK